MSMHHFCFRSHIIGLSLKRCKKAEALETPIAVDLTPFFSLFSVKAHEFKNNCCCFFTSPDRQIAAVIISRLCAKAQITCVLDGRRINRLEAEGIISV